jgi:signal transduction histidine kinase/CheY-like chemotaxis protein
MNKLLAKKYSLINIYFLSIGVICLFIFFFQDFSYSFETNIPAVNIDPKVTSYNLGPDLEIFEDNTNNLSINTINNPSYNKLFHRSIESIPSFGYTDSAIWVRFKLKSAKESVWLLEIDQAMIENIKLFIPDKNDHFIEKETGLLIPFNSREEKYRNFLFRLPLDNTEKTFYMRFESKGYTLQLPLMLWDIEAFNNKVKTENLIFGIFCGIFIVMILYNFVIFFFLKDITYLYYTLYIASTLLVNLTLFGLTAQYLWPNIGELNSNLRAFLIFSAYAFMLIFPLNFLEAKKYLPKAGKYVQYLIIIFFILALLSLTIGIKFPTLISLSGLLTLVIIITMAVYTLIHGFKPARYFLAAWIIFLLAILATILRSLNLVPGNFHLLYSLLIGSSIEVTLLSLALADKFNLLKIQITKTNSILEKEIEHHKITQKELLRVSEALNKDALNSITSHVAILDKDGYIVTVNDYWNKFAIENGGSLEKVGTGINYLDVCRSSIGEFAQTAKEALNGIQKVINGLQNNFSMEYSFNSPVEKRYFLMNVSPLSGKEGVIITHMNITETKLLEEKFLQSQKLEAVGRLASGIAHDFNNLLTVIMGSANLAKFKPGNDLKELDNIIQASQSAASLTQQLLVFARKQVISPKIIELNKLIININNMVYRLLGKNVELIDALTPEPCIIKADPGLIEQVIMNLVINASDAMPNGGKLFIETFNLVIDESETVLLTITDTGSGMTEEIKNHIFEPFFTTKEAEKGTGLGLATSYGIITQAGGNIKVESEIDKGTKFKIYFPKAQGTLEEDFKYKDIHELEKGTETILLIEDEPLVLEITSNILVNQGYKLIKARNGMEAIDIYKNTSEKIDLIITDVMMPTMTGKEVFEVLKAENPDIRVLFMSGYTDDASYYTDLGKNSRFINKPFLPEVILQNIRAILNE